VQGFQKGPLPNTGFIYPPPLTPQRWARVHCMHCNTPLHVVLYSDTHLFLDYHSLQCQRIHHTIVSSWSYFRFPCLPPCVVALSDHRMIGCVPCSSQVAYSPAFYSAWNLPRARFTRGRAVRASRYWMYMFGLLVGRSVC